MKYVFFFLLFCLQIGAANGQTTLISEAVSIRNDFGYELIGRLKDRVLLFRDRYDEYEIQAFDQRLQLDWNREIELEKRGTQVLAVVGGRNDFSVIYKTRRRGEILLRLHKYDPEANLIDSITLKKWPHTPFSSPKLEVLKSENKNCMVVFNKPDRDEMEVVCFFIDKMEVVWDKKMAIENNTADEQVADMTLSDDGQFFLIKELDNRRSKLETHQFSIHQIGLKEEKIWRVPMPEIFTFDVLFEFDNLNRRLVGAGLFGEKKADHANGHFNIRIQPGDVEAAFHSEPFDDKFISILKGKEVENDPGNLSEIDIRQLVFRKDGGVILVAEQNHELTRGSVSGRGAMRDGPRLVVDYFYDDVFAIATRPDGSTHWKTILHKKQDSQDDDATFSSYFLMKTTEKLRFLFNDDIKFESTCSEYVIDPAGAFDRNSLLNTAEQGIRLRFRDGLQLSNREVLVPSEYRNKLRLVLVGVN